MTTETHIPGKDASLEKTIANMRAKLQACDFHLEEKSWSNPVDGIWSAHVSDRDCRILVPGMSEIYPVADMGDTGPFLPALRQLYGAGAVEQAHALIMQTDRFMGLSAPGLAMEGCEMHHKLLKAYDKVHSRMV